MRNAKSRTDCNVSGMSAHTSHTPGPWRAEGRDIRQGQENLIAQVARQTDNNGGDDPIRNANARLIAAAPNMLEALRKAHSMISDEFGIDHPTARLVYDAIRGVTNG